MQALGDIHDPKLRPKLLGSLLLSVPADGKVQSSKVPFIGETIARHHLLQQDAAVVAASDTSTGGSVVDAWFERLLSLLSSAKVIHTLSTRQTTRNTILGLLGALMKSGRR
eukprot:1179871-Prorocentrum_minimum.AAC.4